MLKTDPNALRFWGLDLRSRIRRRLVVTLTYAVYIIGMAVIADKWKSDEGLQNYHVGFFMMLLLSVLVGYLGVFRAGGPVEQSSWTKWRLSKREEYVMLGGLDDRARYHHGEPFDALTEAQQKEILDKYRVGNYLYPASGAKDRLDGKDLAEWGRASSISLGRVCSICFALAGVYGFAKLRVEPEDLTAIFLTLGFLGMTGSKASVLWNEPDVARADVLLPATQNNPEGNA